MKLQQLPYNLSHNWCISTLKVCLFICCLVVVSCNSQKISSNSELNIHNEITIQQIHLAYNNGDYSIEELTQFYLDRIDELNHNGPELNAVITVNPDALDIAKKLDLLHKDKGTQGPLFGIPVLLKDNIDSYDKMPCTAGAAVMAKAFPKEDSPVAAQLRKAGAVILGKANLSEWANFHSNTSSSGWSAIGGQTKNPYRLAYNPCGSSAGSAVGVSANLCVIAIGTETNGSIVCPSNNNGIVGIKPTVGLISRRGIIPISDHHDTAGPMARTVKDAVIALGTMTEIDQLDSKCMEPKRKALTDYTPFLNPDGIEGKRIGYYSFPLQEDSSELAEVMQSAISQFKDQGATIIEIGEFLAEETEFNSFIVMQYEFKHGLNKYLKTLGNQSPVENLAEIIERTFSDSTEMKFHDHELLKISQARSDLSSKEYTEALARIIQESRHKGIDYIMNKHKLDAIIAPTGSPAWKTDLINGDQFGVYSSSPAAIAGYPNISVPMGKIDGLPVGLSIFGRAWSEDILIEIAYAYEQGTKHRFEPLFRQD